MARTTRNRNKPPRATALRTKRPKSLFVPGLIDGRWSPFEHWLRHVLLIYMQYVEVVKPALADDGTVKLDSFGRTAAAAPDANPQIGIDKGAVWFTRETLREGWFNAFGSVAHRFEHPKHYERMEHDRRERPDDLSTLPALKPRSPNANKSTAHPMDQFVAVMVKDYRLIKPRGNRYMLSKEMCEQLEMPEAWHTHLERGARWEGLFYTTRLVPYSQIKVRRRAVLDDRTSPVATIWQPNTTLRGKHNPQQLLWDEVFGELDRYLMFDRHALAEVAVANPVLDVTDPADRRIDIHLSRWCAQGKVTKVMPYHYRAKGFDLFNEEREAFERPIRRTSSEWMIEWIAYWAPIQARGQVTTFTNRIIRAHFAEFADPDWVAENLPNGLTQGTVSSRLAYYKGLGHIRHVEGHQYTLTNATVRLFAPLWEKPDPMLAAAALARLEMQVSELPFEEALELVNEATPGRLIARVIEQAQGLPEYERDAAVVRVCKKVKQPPGRLLDMYKTERAAWSA